MSIIDVGRACHNRVRYCGCEFAASDRLLLLLLLLLLRLLIFSQA